MFARGERNRQSDRARTATLGGHVGRSLGDMPYIMDMVYQSHFMGGYLSTGLIAAGASGTGTTSAVSGVTAVRITSGATASSSVRVDAGSGSNIDLAGFSRDATIRQRSRWSAVDGNAKILTGFACSDGLASAIDGVFFGIDGSVSTSYFVCVARNGGIATTAILDGGGTKATMPVDTAWHDVSIVCDSQNAQVRFYVDKQLAATIEQDLPSDASDYFMPHWSTQNGATATARYVDVDVVVISEAAP